ncbi:hypothetical protein Rhow_004546 [Rhodococcus wratislaviensis]|uniref:Uncharacterized protein n=1 Tax=Rhodococcus wratislaviensis TaxID=44752 RepID=A0A402CBG4_RHOWR|nr:hypothetical protein Rhow_004546 [Rhodococcus wratislaviensis]
MRESHDRVIGGFSRDLVQIFRPEGGSVNGRRSPALRRRVIARTGLPLSVCCQREPSSAGIERDQ